MFKRKFMLTIGMVAIFLGRAEPFLAVNPALLTGRWPASWIAHPDAPPTEPGVFHFRKTFNLPASPGRFVVHLSADNRYRLFLNGQPVSAGPAQSDLMNWRFETVDLGPFLRPGRNVLAAVVWNGGLNRPMAQMSHRTAFILQGDGETEKLVNTDSSWKVLQDPAYQQILYRDNDARLGYQYYVAGALERVDGARYPWSWQQPSFDDTGWAAAAQLDAGDPAGVESHQRWQLTPSVVPQLTETPLRFARLARANTVEIPPGFPAQPVAMSIPPGRRATLLLDQGFLTTGYPVLRVSGGRGAQIQLTYAEALYDSRGEKGDRHQIEGKSIRGIHDLFLTDGGSDREFRPLWVRTWRWLELEVTTFDEPLRIDDISGIETKYPATRLAVFECDSRTLQKIWDACWRTLQLGAQDIFVSDLYWERMQYLEDARLQSLGWLTFTGDDRLVRLSLEQFDQSRVYNGLTLGRYPAFLEQFIPLYSLDWIRMLHEFWMYRGDERLLRRMLPGIRGVLGWYEQQLNSEGFVPLLFHLDFCAHFEEIRRTALRSSTDHTLRYAAALAQAAEIAEALGETHEAVRWRQLAATLRQQIAARSFDKQRGLFSDAPGLELFSSLTNYLAILTDTLPVSEQPALIERVMTDPSLPPPELPTRFYLARALKKTGLADRYPSTLGPWEEMLRLNMTTVGEVAASPRSECHPWSAHPAYDLLATVAGIEPAAPGFRTVRIEPAMGPLQHVHALMPHPLGNIEVWLHRKGDHLQARVVLPPGLRGVFSWKGRNQEVRDSQELSF